MARTEAGDLVTGLPPGVPGGLVRVGRRDVRVVRSEGGTGPLVVFDAGAGASADSWWAVLRRLPDDVRWLAYDRPGLLFTSYDPAADDRLPSTIARDLAALLDVLGETGKVVLVGHSRGGLHVRVFAALYPERVAALILVDPSHERMLDGRQRVLLGLVNRFLTVSENVPALRPLWLKQLLKPEVVGPLGLAPDHEQALRTAYLSDGANRANRLELGNLGPTLEETGRVAARLRLPITVLSGAPVPPSDKAYRLRALINRLHDELWQEPGEHVFVDGAGHLVPMDRPDAAVDAVIAMVRKVS
ncbi:alpha/beta fold hydrolase [Kribbella sp. WER1]